MDMTVAQTILSQLGGRRFLVMTGASDLLGLPDGLTFRVNGRHTTGRAVNKVRVVLTPADTYTVEVWYLRAGNATLVDSREDVYCDVLAGVFTTLTGLHTRL